MAVNEFSDMAQKRGTASAWSSANPVLPDGLVGVQKNTLGTPLMKIGNGIDPWSTLPYLPVGMGANIREASGVVGDGVNDDTTGILAMIATGKNLNFTDGTFILKADATINAQTSWSNATLLLGSKLTTTGTMGANSNTLTIPAGSVSSFVNGNPVTVAGAGAAGGLLTSYVVSGGGTTTLTLYDKSVGAVSGVATNVYPTVLFTGKINAADNKAIFAVSPGKITVRGQNLKMLWWAGTEAADTWAFMERGLFANEPYVVDIVTPDPSDARCVQSSEIAAYWTGLGAGLRFKNPMRLNDNSPLGVISIYTTLIQDPAFPNMECFIQLKGDKAKVDGCYFPIPFHCICCNSTTSGVRSYGCSHTTLAGVEMTFGGAAFEATPGQSTDGLATQFQVSEVRIGFLNGGKQRAPILRLFGDNTLRTVTDVIVGQISSVGSFGNTDTTGTMSLNSTTLTVAAASGITNGQRILVAGAGRQGRVLSTTVVSGGGSTTLVLNDPCRTAVTGVQVSSGMVASSVVEMIGGVQAINIEQIIFRTAFAGMVSPYKGIVSLENYNVSGGTTNVAPKLITIGTITNGAALVPAIKTGVGTLGGIAGTVMLEGINVRSPGWLEGGADYAFTIAPSLADCSALIQNVWVDSTVQNANFANVKDTQRIIEVGCFATTGNMAIGSTSLTSLGDVWGFENGAPITVATAGAAGVTLHTYVVSGAGTSTLVLANANASGNTLTGVAVNSSAFSLMPRVNGDIFFWANIPDATTVNFMIPDTTRNRKYHGFQFNADLSNGWGNPGNVRVYGGVMDGTNNGAAFIASTATLTGASGSAGFFTVSANSNGTTAKTGAAGQYQFLNRTGSTKYFEARIKL